MIGTFLLGMIAGAVGVVLFGNWLGHTEWYKKYMGVKQYDERTGEHKDDMDGFV